MKDTSYFEVDETKDSRIRKCVRQVEDISKPSDIKVPTGLKYRDTWSTTENDELVLSYLYFKNVVYKFITRLWIFMYLFEIWWKNFISSNSSNYSYKNINPQSS